MTNDIEEMDDYADDIDTLLVFVRSSPLVHFASTDAFGPLLDTQAGLFSAAVVSFLIEA